MNSKQIAITDELEALKYTFVELLRMKEKLIINIDILTALKGNDSRAQATA